MRKRIGAAAAIIGMCLSLGPVLAGQAAGKHPELDKLKAAQENAPAAIDFKQMEIEGAFDVLGRIGGFQVTFGEGFPKGKRVTYDITQIPLKDFLGQLADEHGLAYEVQGEHALLIKGATVKP